MHRHILNPNANAIADTKCWFWVQPFKSRSFLHNKHSKVRMSDLYSFLKSGMSELYCTLKSEMSDLYLDIALEQPLLINTSPLASASALPSCGRLTRTGSLPALPLPSVENFCRRFYFERRNDGPVGLVVDRGRYSGPFSDRYLAAFCPIMRRCSGVHPESYVVRVGPQ
jgi:hypothetical protein